VTPQGRAAVTLAVVQPTAWDRHATVVVRVALHPTDGAVVPLIELVEVGSTATDDRVLSRGSSVPDACSALEAWLRQRVRPAAAPPNHRSDDDDRA
jgi:hypothetical protein